MQDNYLKYSAKLTKKWLKDNNINIIKRPSQSPDLNPIENWWRILKWKVMKRKFENLIQFENYCQRERDKISDEEYYKLVEIITKDYNK